MPFSMFTVFEAAALASSLSADAFAAGFAYGSKKIKIPIMSVQIVNLICSAITGLSLFAGTALRPYLPEWLTLGVSFIILLVIGIIKLMDGITKTVIQKHAGLSKEVKFSLFNVKFILNLYASPEEADIDASKTIAPAEAAALALSLSLDGIAVGFGAALAQANALAVLLLSLFTNTGAIMLGCSIGQKIAGKLPFNISWFGGIVLIILAFSKLF